MRSGFFTAAASGHRNVGEVGEALEVEAVGDEALAAPDGAVDAVARSVEREAAHRAGQAVLADHRRDVGVMMLHFDEGRSCSCAHFDVRYSG